MYYVFMNRNNELETTPTEKDFEIIFDSLKTDPSILVSKENKNEKAWVLTFNFDDVVVTIRILVKDYSGADLVITNMTVLPENNQGKGYGSIAVQKILSWAKDNDLNVILATQIQQHNEQFWVRNGFVKVDGINPTNDFVYTKSG